MTVNGEDHPHNFKDMQTVTIYNSVIPNAENFSNILLTHRMTS